MATVGDSFDLGKAIVNKIAEIYLSIFFDQVDNLEIELDSNPQQLSQGKVNSAKFKGKNLIAFQNIEITEFELECNNINFNPAQAILGNIELGNPGNVTAQITLSEADCENIIDSDYVRRFFELSSQELPDFSFYFQHSQCRFSEKNRIQISAKLILTTEKETKETNFQISFYLWKNGREILFEQGQYLSDGYLPLKTTIDILKKIEKLLYLREFHSQNLLFAVDKIEIRANQLILSIAAKIKQVPDSPEEWLEQKISHL